MLMFLGKPSSSSSMRQPPAAIPLPLVRNLIGPYLVFLASTINGYEGTGRPLSRCLAGKEEGNVGLA